MRRTSRRTFLGIALTSPAVFSWTGRAVADSANSTGPQAQRPNPGCLDLNELLAQLRGENGLPALAAGVMKGGELVALGAVGVRKMGAAASVTTSDKFHLGSCTKSMTATLVAMVVAEGKVHWTSTLAEAFPERSAKMHADYRKVSLQMLLTHRSGAPPNGTDYGPANTPVTVQRLAYLDGVVKNPPNFEPGSRFEYSNAGYIIAGTMLERVTGQAWENLMRQRLFGPLGMSSAGFGPPSRPDQTDQPWGHRFKDGMTDPVHGDNHRALGPAGTVHCSITDYLKFARLHASNGLRPPRLLASEVIAKLHEPPVNLDDLLNNPNFVVAPEPPATKPNGAASNQGYAFGWIAVQQGWARGQALTHLGSNTMNLFAAWVAPRIDLCLAVASNMAGNAKVSRGVHAAVRELVRKFAG